ncbi:PilZ domain-containing protein [Mangrovitalea sediminis]|uniref:PilZ domain-containing protein n=1 Tax=Mangrovitalea sediminis TaxID=1982043 RepID=UPI0013044E7C|nr:PilZ domain-containing protein [Mangrovitalea sediminis]
MSHARLRDEVELASELSRLSMNAKLETLEQELRYELEVVSEESPRLGKTLALLDRKLNLMMEMFRQAGASESADLRVEDVSLSAGGILFPVDEWYKTGEHVVLNLVFYPDGEHVRIVARVISCDQSGDGYLIRADFENLAEADREVLVQHVLECQSRALRQRRERQDPT